MAATNTVTLGGYKHIVTTKSISVEHVDKIDLKQRGYKVLIMGPTGAGKSSFIESLGLKGDKKITSSRLEGFTQSLDIYQVNNLTRKGGVVYLLDSPGFADTKISEMAIVSMLEKWLKDNGGRLFQCILYITPITQIRIPGSQRRILKTFRALVGEGTSDKITVVTTMWDVLWGESAIKRAEERFQQLENLVWKDIIEAGGNIVKFYNTRDSALSILDSALGPVDHSLFSIEEIIHGDEEAQTKAKTTFAGHFYVDLQGRVESLQSLQTTIQADLEQAMAASDEQLQSLLRSQQEEVGKDLARFRRELEDLSPLLSLPSLDASIAEPESEVRLPKVVPEASIYPPTLGPTVDLGGGSSSSTDGAVTNLANSATRRDQPQRGRLLRAWQTLKCCGSTAINELHDN